MRETKFLRARFEKNKTIPSNPGEPEKIEYMMKVDKNGHKYLVEAGRTDWYGMIQSHADEVDINRILDSVVKGDYSKLNFDLMELDMTKLPTEMYEYENLRLACEKIWSTLPVETRNEYNHDMSQFFADYGSDKFMAAIGYTKPEETPIKEEVAANE